VVAERSIVAAPFLARDDVIAIRVHRLEADRVATSLRRRVCDKAEAESRREY
jgi:hypothetical protein